MALLVEDMGKTPILALRWSNATPAIFHSNRAAGLIHEDTCQFQYIAENYFASGEIVQSGRNRDAIRQEDIPREILEKMHYAAIGQQRTIRELNELAAISHFMHELGSVR